MGISRVLGFLRSKLDVIVVGALALAAFINARLGQFVSDDNFLIVGNPYLTKPGGWKYWFTHYYMSTEHLSTTNYFRPLPGVSFNLDAKLWGINPLGFHITNLILYTATAVFFYLLLKRLFGNKPIAFVAAALFAVHPVHSEPVAWVSGRPDLFCGLFVVVSMWLFAGWRETGKNSLKLLSSVFFLAALMSKEVTLVSIPFFYALTHLCNPSQKKVSISNRIIQLLPHIVLTLAYLVGRQIVAHASAGIPFSPIYEPSPFLNRLLGMPVNVIRYMELVFCPRSSALYYSATTVSSFTNPAFLASLCGLLILATVTFIYRKRMPAVFWGAIWFIVTLLPATNIVQLPGQTMGERYAYVPSLGGCVITAAILVWLWQILADKLKAVGKAVGAIVFISILSAMAVTSWNGNARWYDDYTIFSKVVAEHPKVPFTHDGLGVEYRKKALDAEAIEEFRTAIKLRPDFAAAHMHLADAVSGNNPTEAIQEYEKCIKYDPTIVPAYQNLAELYLALSDKNTAKAEDVLERGVKSVPYDAVMPYKLAEIYMNQGKNTSKVIELLEKTVKDVPDADKARFLLGRAYVIAGRDEDAKSEFNWIVDHSSGLSQQASEELEKLDK